MYLLALVHDRPQSLSLALTQYTYYHNADVTLYRYPVRLEYVFGIG